MLWLVVSVLGASLLVVLLVRALWVAGTAWVAHRRARANRCEREVPDFGPAQFDGRGTWSFRLPFGNKTLWAHVAGTPGSPSDAELRSLAFAREHLAALAGAALPQLSAVLHEWHVHESATSAVLEGVSAYPAHPEPAFGLCFSTAADPDGVYEVRFRGLTAEAATRDD